MDTECKVLPFTGGTTVQIPVPKVLAGAEEADLAEVVVVGIDREGAFYIASSLEGTAEMTVVLLERAKLRLLDMIERAHSGER